MSPRAWNALTMVSLSSGEMRLKTPGARQTGRQRTRRQRAQLAAVDRLVVGHEHAKLAAHGFGCRPLIAGEHHGAQARAAQTRDGLLHAMCRRVHQAKEAGKGQVRQSGLVGAGHFAGRHAKDAQALGGQPPVLGQKWLATVGIERAPAIGRLESSCTSRRVAPGRPSRLRQRRRCRFDGTWPGTSARSKTESSLSPRRPGPTHPAEGARPPERRLDRPGPGHRVLRRADRLPVDGWHARRRRGPGAPAGRLMRGP